jgi:hypothetical protein
LQGSPVGQWVDAHRVRRGTGKELRKTMVGALVKKYQSAPKLESLENDRLIKKFTRDIDKTVRPQTLVSTRGAPLSARPSK